MEPFAFDVAGLRYTLDELPSPSSSKTVVSVSLCEEAPAQPGASSASSVPAAAAQALVDRVDLFSFGSRRRFAQLVAGQFGRGPDAVLGQLAAVLDAAARARAEAESPEPV